MPIFTPIAAFSSFFFSAGKENPNTNIIGVSSIGLVDEKYNLLTRYLVKKKELGKKKHLKLVSRQDVV